MKRHDPKREVTLKLTLEQIDALLALKEEAAELGVLDADEPQPALSKRQIRLVYDAALDLASAADRWPVTS